MPWLLRWPLRSAQGASSAPPPDAAGSVEPNTATVHADGAIRSAGDIPPLPHLLGPISTTAGISGFTASLAGPKGLPPIIRPLVVGHSDDGPVGLVRGLTVPAAGARVRVAAERGGATGESWRGEPGRSGTGSAPDLSSMRHLPAVDPAAADRARSYTEVDAATAPATAVPAILVRGEVPRPATADAARTEVGFAETTSSDSARPAAATTAERGIYPEPGGAPMSLGQARRLGLGAPLASRPATSRPVPGLGGSGGNDAVSALPTSAALGSGLPAAPQPLPAPRNPATARAFAGGAVRSLPALHAYEAGEMTHDHSAEHAAGSAGGAPSDHGSSPRGVGSSRPAPAAAGSSPGGTGHSAGSAPMSIQRSSGAPAAQSSGPTAARPAAHESGRSFAVRVVGGGSAAPASVPTEYAELPLSHVNSTSAPSVWAAPAEFAFAEFGFADTASAAKPFGAPSVQRSSVAESPSVQRTISFGPPAPTSAESDVTISRAPASGAGGSAAAGGAAGAGAAGSGAAGNGAPSEDQLDNLAGQVYSRIRDRLGADLLRERERAGLLADL